MVPSYRYTWYLSPCRSPKLDAIREIMEEKQMYNAREVEFPPPNISNATELWIFFEPIFVYVAELVDRQRDLFAIVLD